MAEIVNSIIGSAESFTPSAVVGLIVYCTLFESLCLLIGSMIRVVRR